MEQVVAWLLVWSALIQATGVYIAVRLVRVTGRSIPWLLIAAGLAMMLLRRIMLLATLGLTTDPSVVLRSELFGLVNSILLTSGLYFIEPLFVQVARARDDLARRDALLTGLTEASATLLACGDLDSLHRAAVEYAGRRLGVVRCGLLVAAGEEGVLRGTYCHGLDGRVVDLRTVLIHQSRVAEAAQEAIADPHREWAVIDHREIDCRDGGLTTGERPSWLACTPIASAGSLRAVLLNDPGAGDGPPDPVVQGVLVVYCAMLGRLLERHEVEVQANERERRYHQVIALSGGVAYHRDFERDAYTFISPEVEDLTGIPAGELTPSVLDSMVRRQVKPIGGSSAKLDASTAPRAAAGAAHLYRSDYLIETRDGRTRWLSDVALQYRNEQDRLVRSVGLLQDITARKAIEEELHTSQKMEALGRLAGGVAHDFNNLLTTILGYSELLGRSFEEGDDRGADLRRIATAAESAALLTGQLLAFSRRQVMQPRALDLNAVVLETEPLLRRVVREDVRLVMELGRGLPPALADPAQLQQVALNLAMRARDVMPAGGTLHLSTGRSPAGRPALRVADDGERLDDAALDKVFEPWSGARGGGLGMATVYGIVTQSDGTITVERPAEGGTAFVVEFPAAAAAAAADAAGEDVPAADGSGRTVLLVEDNDSVRELAAEVLTGQGYRVIAARDARHAYELLDGDQEPLDLLLTDIVMPGISGPELAADLTARRPGLPVLFMSGHPADELDRHGLRLTSREFVAKPFRPGELLRKVAGSLLCDGPAPQAGCSEAVG